MYLGLIKNLTNYDIIKSNNSWRYKMQYLRQTVVALSVLLAGVGCSENPTQRELTDETIRLNKTLIDEGAINPKTQFLKHGEDAKVVPHVAPKVITTKHVSISGDIEKLMTERDAAIRANVELKKINSDLKSQKLTLSKNQSSLKGKIAASAAALLAAQQLTTDKDAEIAKLISERDEAIKVTLEMKKANTEFEAKASQASTEVTEKMQALQLSIEKTEALLEDKKREIDKLTNDLSHMNDNIKRETEGKQKAIDKLAELKDKLSTSASELITAKSLITDKEGEINSLAHERDDAIKVTLEMKKENEALNDKLNNLAQVQSESASMLKEKIGNLASLLTEAEQLNADSNANIEKLTKERDAAIQVTMGLKKESEAFEIQKQETAQNESISKEKISQLADLLSEAEKSTVDKDADIARLTKERDAAIQVSMGMQKKLEEGQKASTENAKKLVIDNIVSTFKLSKVEFKTGSAILTDKSTELLDRVAGIMSDHTEYNYKIQGHTDSQGKQALNLKLSQARADSVKNYLVSKGIADTVLSTEGFGASVPIADNATKEGRLQNRRVVFEIVD